MSALLAILKQVDREAWIRFFLALVGLSLALVSALYSTVFREQGNLWATAIAGSLALLLAGVVGLTTVPYLARRVAVERVRQAFEYDVTREGVVYLIVALVIGIAALNTGNNLLFIILSAMLAAIVVSGVASAGMLRGLEMELSIPDHIFARTSVAVRVRLHNRRKRAPAFSVEVAPPAEKKPGERWRIVRSEFRFPKAKGRRQWVRLPDLTLRKLAPQTPQQSIFRHNIYFPMVPAAAHVDAHVQFRFERRGRYVQEGLGLATRFPFSFLVKTRRVAVAREVVVYPSVEPADDFFRVLPMLSGEFEAFVRGRGSDLYRIREYEPEDSARHVDWKATARSGSLKVREFTREDERKVRIVFDNPPAGALSPAAYERAVQLAASLTWHFADGETELSFAAPGYEGSPDAFDFLRYLALVQPAAENAETPHWSATQAYSVVLTARPRGSIPTELWASAYLVFVNELEA